MRVGSDTCEGDEIYDLVGRRAHEEQIMVD